MEITEAQRLSLIEYLSEFVSEARLKKIEEVLNNRTNYLTIVLEDLHKPHNANAVLRSCDGFGIQDVHIIENVNQFGADKTVSLGAHQWLTLHRYNSPQKDNVTTCFKELRRKGYKILATTPHEQDISLYDLDLNQKTALVFGTELNGVSENVMAQADGFVKIPMYGFSESFNISVSAAVFMYELTRKLRQTDVDWTLSEDYKLRLKYEWLRRSIKAGDQLVQKFLSE